MTGTTVPSWLTFTASTGVLTGTPTNDDVGTSGNDVVITVTDAHRNPYFNMITINDDGFSNLVIEGEKKVSRKQIYIDIKII